MGTARTHLKLPARRLAAASACLAALAAAAPAAASKGVTATDAEPLPPESSHSATATCPAKTHSTSGGFQVLPGGTPGSAFQSVTQVNNRSGNRSWAVTSGAEMQNDPSAVLTAFVRCERRVDSKIVVPLTGSASINPGFAQTFNFHCPPQTRPVGAGWSVDNPFNGNVATTSNLIVVQDRRLDRDSWTITAEVRSGSAVPSVFTATVPCEKVTARRITQRTTIVSFNNDQRATATATCRRGSHVVAGGFVINPLPPGTVPFAPVDRHAPVGGRSWRVDIYDTVFGLPPGSTLTTYAYCRRNRLRRRRARGSTASASAAPIGPGRVELLPPVLLAG